MHQKKHKDIFLFFHIFRHTYTTIITTTRSVATTAITATVAAATTATTTGHMPFSFQSVLHA